MRDLLAGALFEALFGFDRRHHGWLVVQRSQKVAEWEWE